MICVKTAKDISLWKLGLVLTRTDSIQIQKSGNFALAGVLLIRLKVIVIATADLYELGLEGFDLLTFGRSLCVEEFFQSIHAGQLEMVGVSEGHALLSSGTVVSCLGCLYLVV